MKTNIFVEYTESIGDDKESKVKGFNSRKELYAYFKTFPANMPLKLTFPEQGNRSFATTCGKLLWMIKRSLQHT